MRSNIYCGRFLVLLIAVACGCSESPQAKAVRFLEKGKAAYQKQNFDVAVLHFKNAVQAQPRDAEPYYQLGLAYLALGDFSPAYSSFHKATELNAKHSGAQLKVAELMALSQTREVLEEALKRSQDVVAMLPGNAEALSVLAVTELRLGKVESAESHLEEAIRNSPEHLQSAMILARTRLARKDTAGAEEVLKRAAEQSPKAPEPRFQLGDFYLALQKPAEAEQEFRRALAIDPKHGPTLLALAGIKARAGQADQAEQLYREIATLPEKQYKSVHALYLFQSGKHAEALAELQKLVKASPQDRNLRTQLVTAHFALNQLDDAKKVLSDALKENGRDVEALLQRSRILIAGKNFAEAQSDLERVLRFRPASAEAHYLLSKVSQGRGNTALRRQELNEALRLDPGHLNSRVELAQTLRVSGGAEQALKLLDETPRQQKGVPGVVAERNWALLALGRADEARQAVNQALAAKAPEAILQDAVLKLSRKDYTGARASAEAVLAQAPAELRALSLLVQTYIAQGQMAAGVKRAQEHAAKQPQSAVIQHFIGRLLASSGDRAGARRAFEAAKTAGLDGVAADVALADMDSAEGKHDSARQRLAAILQAHPDNLNARILSAQVDLLDGKTTPAVEQYRKILQMDAQNFNALNNLAYLLADAGAPDEALKYAQQAKQLKPDAASVDDTLGWTYYRKGMYSLALTHLQSAVSREPNARRQYHLAMAYAKSGDASRARQVFDAAVKADPNLPEAQLARELLPATPAPR